MIGIRTPDAARAARGDGNDAATAAPADVTVWLHFAATPVFAFMALITALATQPDIICSAVHSTSPLGGMVSMYLLMSAFHSAPWLRLLRSGTVLANK